MSTLSFQPEADRYYAEGYWRSGDLWGDFAARAHDIAGFAPAEAGALLSLYAAMGLPAGLIVPVLAARAAAGHRRAGGERQQDRAAQPVGLEGCSVGDDRALRPPPHARFSTCRSGSSRKYAGG